MHQDKIVNIQTQKGIRFQQQNEEIAIAMQSFEGKL